MEESLNASYMNEFTKLRPKQNEQQIHNMTVTVRLLINHIVSVVWLLHDENDKWFSFV
jgi:hypothetical protein